jgi:hypothetical protein
VNIAFCPFYSGTFEIVYPIYIVHDVLIVEQLVLIFSRIHLGKCIGFIEEEAKTADTTSKGSTIQTRRHADNNTTHTSQVTRLALHRLPPRMARRGYTELLGRVTP